KSWPAPHGGLRIPTRSDDVSRNCATPPIFRPRPYRPVAAAMTAPLNRANVGEAEERSNGTSGILWNRPSNDWATGRYGEEDEQGVKGIREIGRTRVEKGEWSRQPRRLRRTLSLDVAGHGKRVQTQQAP